MTDFFDDQSKAAQDVEESLNVTDEPAEDAEQAEEVAEEPTAETIKVGDKEYTQEELNRLVSLGEIGREAEEKYNTKIDSVWPEFSKSRNEVKELRDQLEQYKQGNTQPLMEGDDAQVREALEAAKRLGIMTRDEFDQAYAERRESERLLERTESLESTYNGADGRPKFDKLEILEYMQQTGVRDPEIAYKTKYEKQLDEWKEKKLSGAKKENITTTQTGGGSNKRPEEVRPTTQNIGDLIRESLGQ